MKKKKWQNQRQSCRKLEKKNGILKRRKTWSFKSSFSVPLLFFSTVWSKLSEIQNIPVSNFSSTTSENKNGSDVGVKNTALIILLSPAIIQVQWKKKRKKKTREKVDDQTDIKRFSLVFSQKRFLQFAKIERCLICLLCSFLFVVVVVAAVSIIFFSFTFGKTG